jgi:hypothetical protein
MSRFGTLEEQCQIKLGSAPLRILPSIYGDRLVARGELGALMGGDRSPRDIQDKWDSLEKYEMSDEDFFNSIRIRVRASEWDLDPDDFDYLFTDNISSEEADRYFEILEARNRAAGKQTVYSSGEIVE